MSYRFSIVLALGLVLVAFCAEGKKEKDAKASEPEIFSEGITVTPILLPEVTNEQIEGLTVTPLFALIDKPIIVSYGFQSYDHALSDHQTELKGNTIIHSSRILNNNPYGLEYYWAPHWVGFSERLVLSKPGTYFGEVQQNSYVVARYKVELFLSEHDAGIARIEFIKSAKKKDPIVDLIPEIMNIHDRELELLLANKVNDLLVLSPENYKSFYYIMDWLQKTPNLDVVRIFEPQLRRISDSSGTTNEYKKWLALGRIVSDEELSQCLINGSASTVSAVSMVVVSQNRKVLVPVILKRLDKELDAQLILKILEMRSPEADKVLAALLEKESHWLSILSSLGKRACEEPFRSLILTKREQWIKKAEQSTDPKFEKSIINNAMCAILENESKVESLIELFKDETSDLTVRSNIVDAIGRIGNKKAVECLIELFKDETLDWDTTRYKIALLLGRIGDKKAVECLIEALEYKKAHSNLFSVIWALKKITKQDFGMNCKEWDKWWKENKDKL